MSLATITARVGAESRGFTRHIFQDGAGSPVSVLLPAPDPLPIRSFIGREQAVERCAAAWLSMGGASPLHLRLVGPPGVGKNALVYHLAQKVEQKQLWILQGHDDLAPEDLACTPRIADNGRIEYVGSPLLAAMIQGGICFFDEIGKVPGRALSLLASVLDDRRTLTSVLAGFTVTASPDFRFVAAMNESDDVAGGLPEYLDERLRPVLRLDHPPVTETLAIVRSAVPYAEEVLLEAVRKWLVSREAESVRVSPRQALTLLSFASRLLLVGRVELTPERAEDLIQRAAEMSVGGERNPGAA